LKVENIIIDLFGMILNGLINMKSHTLPFLVAPIFFEEIREPSKQEHLSRLPKHD